MTKFTKLVFLAVFAIFMAAGSVARAQDIAFNYTFQFEPTFFTDGPNIKDFYVNYPEEARKNGVDGTAKVTFVLGNDGKTRDAVITQNLSHGVGDALLSAIAKMVFTPAMNEGRPVDMRATLVYNVTALFQEYDNNVSRVKLIGKPTAEYPAAFRAEGTKGKVLVSVIFYPDGKVKVLYADSTMPKEFDDAAKKAAENLKFQPAVHKKSKKAVAQSMRVTFEFKP
jgi:TonB family protein